MNYLDLTVTEWLLWSIGAIVILFSILYTISFKKNKKLCEQIEALELRRATSKKQISDLYDEIKGFKKEVHDREDITNVPHEELRDGNFVMLDEYEHPRMVKLICKADQGVNANNEHITGWTVRYEMGNDAVVDKNRITGLQRRWHNKYNVKGVRKVVDTFAKTGMMSIDAQFHDLLKTFSIDLIKVNKAPDSVREGLKEAISILDKGYDIQPNSALHRWLKDKLK